VSTSGLGCLPAFRAQPEDFQAMSLNCEVVAFPKLRDDRLDRTRGKRHDVPTLGADQVMSMTGFADDIGRVAVRAQEPREDIDRRHNLERSVHSCATDIWEELNELFGRKWPCLLHYGFNYFSAGVGCTVAVLCQHRECFGWRNRGKGRVHTFWRLPQQVFRNVAGLVLAGRVP
jgi:hypothetical protein